MLSVVVHLQFVPFYRRYIFTKHPSNVITPNTTTCNIFLREEKGNAQQTIVRSLNEAVRQNAIRVRILTYKDMRKQIEKLIATQQKNNYRKKSQKEQEEGRGLLGVGVGKQEGRFEIHLADILQQQQPQQKRLQTKVSFLIVDSKVSLVEEEIKAYNNNKNNDDSNEAQSLATYSNSESTVLTYISIFETLCVQTETTIQNIR
jgi:hypothetical protein